MTIVGVEMPLTADTRADLKDHPEWNLAERYHRDDIAAVGAEIVPLLDTPSHPNPSTPRWVNMHRVQSVNF